MADNVQVPRGPTGPPTSEMPQLPVFNPLTNVNESPHVVIVGAGASRAAFPNGDANGSRLPLMVDLVDCLGLGQAFQAAGFQKTVDFEALYDELATTGMHRSLREEIEAKVWSYFDRLQLPDAPTLYDYLLLSMRPKDFGKSRCLLVVDRDGIGYEVALSKAGYPRSVDNDDV